MRRYLVLVLDAAVMQNSLKQLSTAALRQFARTYGSKQCFQQLPEYHKNAFALNIFAMKQEVRHSFPCPLGMFDMHSVYALASRGHFAFAPHQNHGLAPASSQHSRCVCFGSP